ncbi:MAG: methyltransferase [Euryarchaeota archaeon]|nr:methyltransferase [Euryarchaeota archaeon]
MDKIIYRVPEVDFGLIDEIAKGNEKANILFAALDYGIFELLAQPKTADHVSEEIKTNPYLTEKFLNALVALNFIHKIENRYSNTKLAETFLVRKSPFYQGTLFEMKRRGSTDWQRIRDALKNGGIKAGTENKSIIDRTFIVGHAEIAITGAMQRAADAVSTLPEYEKAKKLLDLGGGHGLYSIAFSQLNPELEVVLFDLPHVTEIAKEYLEQYGTQGKIKFIAGDFTEDDIGNGYDIVFVSDVTISGILKKVYDALNENGVLIYRRWTINDDRTSPLTSVLFDFMLAMMRSEHRVYTLGEYIRLLEATGFSITRILDISSPQDPTKIIVAKKKRC